VLHKQKFNILLLHDYRKLTTLTYYCARRNMNTTLVDTTLHRYWSLISVLKILSLSHLPSVRKLQLKMLILPKSADYV